MKITLEIPNERIANLMCSAIEGGDPVTTARKGGWCTGIYAVGKKAGLFKYWYAEAAFFDGDFAFDVEELLDESKEAKGKNLLKHRVNAARVRVGLKRMAKLFPRQFEQVLADNIDAPAADCFLQAMCFGKEKYA